MWALLGLSSENDQALYEASVAGDIAQVKQALEKGARPNGKNGNHPLHCSKTAEVAQLLLDHGADLEHPTALFGATPLHVAALHGRTEVLQFLLGRHANLEARTKNGETPLHWAAYYGRTEAVRLLLGVGANVEATDKDGKTPLHEASRLGRTEVVRFLLTQGRANAEAISHARWRPLHFAAMKNHQPVVQLFLDHGVDTEVHNSNNRTPLQLAAFWGHVEVANMLRARKEERTLANQREEMTESNQLNHPQHMERRRLSSTTNVQHHKVFLSHTGQDSSAALFAGLLAERLHEKYNIPTFLDSHSLETGDLWRQAIQENAQNCQVFVCILSPLYFERYWCLHELDLALHSKTNPMVIPVYLEGEIPTTSTSNSYERLFDLYRSKHREQQRGTNESAVVHRWCDNLSVLESIQGLRNYSTHKLSMIEFRSKVASVIHEKLSSSSRQTFSSTNSMNVIT